MAPCKRGKGFTLLELLVVVAIIGVLLSMLLGGVAAARVSANGARCTSNLRNLGVASLLYAKDHQNNLPIPTKWAAPDNEVFWWVMIGPYLYDAPPFVVDDTFRCPAGEGFHISERGLQGSGWRHIDYAQFLTPYYVGTANLSAIDADKSALLVDGENYEGYLGIEAYCFAAIVNKRAKERHRGKSNVLFCNGRVEALKDPTWEDLRPKSAD